jgi:hypothetical protein
MRTTYAASTDQPGAAESTTHGVPRGDVNHAIKLSSAIRWLLTLASVATFGAGCAAVFALEGGGGAGGAALLAVGVACAWIAATGVLPVALKVAGVELTLPEKAERLAEEAIREGRPDVARALRVSAQLAATAEPFSQIYESIREIVPPGDDRTTALDALVAGVEKQTRDGRWSMEEARALFESGHEGARVFALAMMQATPRAEEADLALDAVMSSKSGFEQWHGLTALQRMLPHVTEAWRTQLEDALPAVDFKGESANRAALRDEILTALRSG